MTTNQTIDGVPGLRELLKRLLAWLNRANELNGDGDIAEYVELRALLDAPAVEVRDKCGVQMVDCPECSHQWDHFFECGNGPANPKPTGLSQGWNLTRKHDGFVVGHQSVAYPPDEKAIERAERDGYVWAPFLVPAAQPQGEPGGITEMPEMFDRRPGWPEGYMESDNDWCDNNPLAVSWLADNHAAIRAALYAEQPAPVAVVPDGYCIMPCQLTAENGAKALLLGEFKLLVTKECPECCELEEPTEGCSICDGEGEYGQKHTIPWDQIKFIYSKAVSGLAVKAESAKSR